MSIKKAFDFFCVQPDSWDINVPLASTPSEIITVFRYIGVDLHLYKVELNRDVVSDRDASQGSYGARFIKSVVADPDLASKSASLLKTEEVKGITLLERLLLELGYFLSTGKHLDDVNTMTLCSGSRYLDGRVPTVSWHQLDKKLYIGWNNVDDTLPDLRARRLITP